MLIFESVKGTADRFRRKLKDLAEFEAGEGKLNNGWRISNRRIVGQKMHQKGGHAFAGTLETQIRHVVARPHHFSYQKPDHSQCAVGVVAEESAKLVPRSRA